MSTALITGAGGFVGHHVFESLLVNTDHKLVLLDSFRHRGLTDRVREVLDDRPLSDRGRVNVLSHDISAPISSVLARAIGPVDTIYNLASESHVDRSIESPRPFIENNVGLMLTMLDYARVSPPRVFIQISTDEVYGPAPTGTAHVEWDTSVPSNPYSASKAAQESIAIAYWRTYGVPVVLTNTMNIFGERQDCEKYLPMLIRDIRDGKCVRVHADPETGIIGSRFYLHARNQASALQFVADRVPANYGDYDRPDRYNIVGNREVSNLELAQLVAEILGKPLNYELVDFHSSRPGHDLRYALDGRRLDRLGWFAPVDFQTSLERTVRWSIDHPYWLETHD